MAQLRTTLRTLARAPIFSLTATLTLAVGLGMAAAMVTVVRETLLAPLPYAHPDRLVAIAFQYPGESPSTAQVGTAIDYLRQNSRSFSAIGYTEGGPTGVNLATSAAGAAHAFPTQQFRVSAGFLPTLGIQPLLGRNFTAEEDTHHGPRAALLSYSFWQSRLAADPHILGRTLRLDGADVPVVGVLPPNALADLAGTERGAEPTAVWQPLQMSPKDAGYEGTNYKLIARLRPGVSLRAAQDELDALLPQFARDNAWYKNWRMPNGALNHFGVWPLQAALTGDVRASLWTLLGAVLAVLLVACLNLAGLMVARTTARTRELAVRSALGASRIHLLRLVLLESVVLAVLGALGSIVVARAAAAAFFAFAPLEIPQFQPHTSILPTVGAALALAFASMLFFGLLPALLALRSDVSATLQRSSSRGATAGFGLSSRILVVAQVSLALLLLYAASLLWSAFLHLRSTAPGVRTDHLAIAQVTLKGDRYASNLRTTQFVSRVLDTLAHQPGVSATAAVNGLPFDRALNIDGWPVGNKDLHHSIEARFATPTYLRTMGIDLLGGRAFTDGDTATAPRVAIVSETAARYWWPGRSPLGERIDVGNETEYEIVGMSRDTHEHTLADSPRILVYVPLTQVDDRFTKIINNWFPTTFVARAADGVDLAPVLTAAVSGADADLPVARFSTMQAVVNETIQAPQFLSWLSASFAAFTLGLAMLGLFGLLSYQVTERIREIAVRMALGATRPNVVLTFLRRGLSLTGAGVLLGIGGTLLLPRLLLPILQAYVLTGSAHPAVASTQQVETTLIATLLLFLAALAACALPVHRAASTDPANELRGE